MSTRPNLKHVRRLSLFGIGSRADDAPQPDEQRLPRDSHANSSQIKLSASLSGRPKEQLGTPLRRTQTSFYSPVSKKLTKKHPKTPSHADTSFASTSESIENGPEDQSPLRKRKSFKLRVAVQLSTIFVPKSRKKASGGMLDGIDGIKYSCDTKRRNGDGGNYCYVSRSPSPPSPDIRPPSGLGQIADEVDLEAYVREQRENSLRVSRTESLSVSISRTVSRTPSVTFSVPFSMDANTHTPPTSVTHETMKTVDDLFFSPVSPATPPSQTMLEAVNISAGYCGPEDLAQVALACRAFLEAAQSALYTKINSDDLQSFGDDGRNREERRRRRLLETLSNNTGIAGRVKRVYWVCRAASGSGSTGSSPSSLQPPYVIPRRAPIVSISASPEEFILPRVLALLPNLVSLHLVHPPATLLSSFFPSQPSPRRSPRASPKPSSRPSSPTSAQDGTTSTMLTSLVSLTLSGRTTLSTSFASALLRFLEQHPGIRELSLPDVFCLPIPTPTPTPTPSPSRHTHSASSSPHELIPPVPPLPPSLIVKRDSTPRLLPNLTNLTAPLTLVKQLVPGRPVRVLDVELSTSLYEGFKPAEAARCLGAGVSARSVFQGTSAASSQPELNMGLRELRIRCTAKVDGRTAGRLLNALGGEVGASLVELGLGWSGVDQELYAQITPAIARFRLLYKLILFRTSEQEELDSVPFPSMSDTLGPPKNQSQADTTSDEAAILAEQTLVEQWSRLCPELSHIEFPSERIWKAK